MKTKFVIVHRLFFLRFGAKVIQKSEMHFLICLRSHFLYYICMSCSEGGGSFGCLLDI